MDLQGSHHFTVRYDEDIVRDAIRTFIWRRAIVEQKVIWITSVLMAVSSFYFLFWGDAGWMAGVMLGVALLPLVFVAVFWRVRHANTLNRFKRMDDQKAEITMDGEGMQIRPDPGSGRTAWRDVIEVWERPGSFIVFSGAATFDTLPRDGMPEEVQAFLRTRPVQD
ncbi:hypothetical protein EPK99_16355 [Neorhizobium lilium]|uniref:YcxB-like protein n=1 Tax=Neorhizobium lilium TaxID=2503024 RepID=A0A3S4UMU6_9HYPH|nr:YcxB family protein [Neorhizobium lilium]RWX77215.1 hypothetical protein EPK99_16355 [Neorhizobium lilium]